MAAVACRDQYHYKMSTIINSIVMDYQREVSYQLTIINKSRNESFSGMKHSQDRDQEEPKSKIRVEIK